MTNVKKGDILYCHTTVYHENDVIFKEGNKYTILEVNTSIPDDHFVMLDTEAGDMKYLIGLNGTGKCKNIKNFYTQREYNLNNLIDGTS